MIKTEKCNVIKRSGGNLKNKTTVCSYRSELHKPWHLPVTLLDGDMQKLTNCAPYSYVKIHPSSLMFSHKSFHYVGSKEKRAIGCLAQSSIWRRFYIRNQCCLSRRSTHGTIWSPWGMLVLKIYRVLLQWGLLRWIEREKTLENQWESVVFLRYHHGACIIEAILLTFSCAITI